MIAEAFGARPNGLGEQPQVIAHTLGHDIEVTPRLFGLLPNLFSQPAKPHISVSKLLIDPLESLIDLLESRVHGSFELGNRHGFTPRAHHSIVVHATTMP